jgi:hypothetical protein
LGGGKVLDACDGIARETVMPQKPLSDPRQQHPAEALIATSWGAEVSDARRRFAHR